MSRHIFSPLLALFFALPLVARDRFDAAVETDMAGESALVLRLVWRELDLGVVLEYAPAIPTDIGQTFDGMAGINLPFLAAGHLELSGLLLEVRHPGPGALARTGERTRCRSDTRSRSRYSWGIALFDPSGRLGVSYGGYPGYEEATLWGAPIQSDSFSLEALAAVAFGEPILPNGGWYPEETGSPGGHRGSAAIRGSIPFTGGVVSITVIGSAGENVRPGLLGAVGFKGWGGPWIVRFRGTVRTPHFRDTDGDHPDTLFGVALDVRRRPVQGMLWDFRYEAGLEEADYGGAPFADRAEWGVGWSTNRWSLELATAVRALASTPSDPEDRWPHRVRGELRLIGETRELDVAVGWYRDDGLRVDLRGEAGIGKRFSGYAGCDSVILRGGVSVDFEAGLRWSYPGGWLRLDIDMVNLTDQFLGWNPRHVDVALRWCLYINSDSSE